MIFFWAFIALSCMHGLVANSLSLTNDSPVYLRVAIFAANGDMIGETVIAPGASNNWSDDFLYSSPKAFVPKLSQTPYTVHWYCMDGGDYSICSQQGAGSTINAQSCSGAKQCKSKKYKPGENLLQPTPGGFETLPQFPPTPPENSNSGQ